jgi:RNA polymerase sigma-70 factor (ECF subfamily)
MNSRQAEFERVAMPHLDSLLRFARRLSGDDSSARDLVQDTFLRAWRGFGSLRPESNVRAWLFQILIHAWRDAGRKALRSVLSVPLSRGMDFPGASDEPLEILDALDRLPEDQRTVLILGAVEGFTCREISEILGVPIGTAMSRLSRGRQALREALQRVPEKVAR